MGDDVVGVGNGDTTVVAGTAVDITGGFGVGGIQPVIISVAQIAIIFFMILLYVNLSRERRVCSYQE